MTALRTILAITLAAAALAGCAAWLAVRGEV